MIREGRLSPRLLAWGVSLAFLCMYCSISLYNHYVFRTFAFDLGIKNQAIWDYAHFRYSYSTVMTELHGEINILANHFEPVLFLFGPLYWIFGSYTLLVVQIAFIILGGWGIYRYFRISQSNPWLAVAAMAVFYGIWAIFGALAYDFHTNVLGAMLVPWIVYFMERRKIWAAVLVAFVLMNCKENMALWSVFIGLGLALHYRRSRPQWAGGLAISALGAVYFILVMKVFMPYYAAGRLPYLHFSYSALGEDFGEAFRTLLTKPWVAVKLLFVNHLPHEDAYNDVIKMQLHSFVMLSGGIFLFFRPQFLIMLIPIYAQKMFSDDPGKWGIYNQYSIEFVPVIALAAFSVISSWRDRRVQIAAGALVFLSAFDTTKGFIDMWQPTDYYKRQTKFYSPVHYEREIPVAETHRALRRYVPDGVPVSATFYLLPHLAGRSGIYLFPARSKADYVVWCSDGVGSYPLNPADDRKTLDSLLTSGEWTTDYTNNQLYILHRNEPVRPE